MDNAGVESRTALTVTDMNRPVRCTSRFVASAIAITVLCGCAETNEQERPSSPPPSATLSPAEIELESVTVALERFAALSSEALATGRIPAELDALVSPTLLASVAGDVAAFAANGYRLMGSISIDSVAVTSEVGATRLVAVACLDSSDSAVEDANGQHVPGGGVERQPVVAELLGAPDATTIDLFVYDTLEEVGSPCAS